MNNVLSQLETALDNGTLVVTMMNGRRWKARRNGATKTWKRDAHRFSIPFKVGLKTCGRLTEVSLWSFDHDGGIVVERV